MILFHKVDDNKETDSSNLSDDGDGVHQNLKYDKNKMTVDLLCPECSKRYRDPTNEELNMYLHALTYKVNIV